MSIRLRLTLIIGASVAVAALLAGGIAFWSTGRELRQGIDDFLVGRTEIVELIPGGLFSGLPLPIRPPGRDLSVDVGATVQVLDERGEIFLTVGPLDLLPVSDSDIVLAMQGGEYQLRDDSVDGNRVRMITRPIPSGGAMQMARDLTEVESVMTSLAARLLLLAGFATGAAALVGWLVAVRFVAPIEKLSDAADEVARTQSLTGPIEVARSDEVGQLADSFNTMLLALAAAKQQQEQLIADASHELRTPLTSLRTNIELLERADDLPADERADLMADTQMELAELSHLVAELVDLATEAASPEEPTEVDVGVVARRVVDQAAQRTGREITIAGSGFMVRGHPQQLERATRNLVDNAIKWSVSDGLIEVKLEDGRLSVSDRGPGIDEQHLGKVFDRFYRSTDARSMPGSGLGLAIVKQAAEADGGRVFAESRNGGGATVGFEIPVLASENRAHRG